MTVEQAIQTIVDFQTIPQHHDILELRAAEELIESLPTVEQNEAYETIQAQIDDFFTPSFWRMVFPR